MDKVKNNIDLATDAYIDRANKSPCGDTVIQLFKGSNSIELQIKRDHILITFLKLGAIPHAENIAGHRRLHMCNEWCTHWVNECNEQIPPLCELQPMHES